MKPTTGKEFLEQVLAMGQSHEIWVRNSMVLRRAADVLLQLSREAGNRLSKLAFSEPAPPTGETRKIRSCRTCLINPRILYPP